MNRAGGREFARVKMERVDTDQARIELGIRLEELPERLRGNVATTRDRDVRMPWAKLRLETGGQGGFLDALVNLKKMWVCFADADPDDFRRAS